MSGECGPSASDLVFYLGGILVHECDRLPKILDSSCTRKYRDMHPVDLDFSQFGCFLVCQNFRFVLAKFEPLRFCTFFEVRDHLFELLQRGRNTSSAERRLDMQPCGGSNFYINTFSNTAQHMTCALTASANSRKRTRNDNSVGELMHFEPLYLSFSVIP